MVPAPDSSYIIHAGSGASGQPHALLHFGHTLSRRAWSLSTNGRNVAIFSRTSFQNITSPYESTSAPTTLFHSRIDHSISSSLSSCVSFFVFTSSMQMLVKPVRRIWHRYSRFSDITFVCIASSTNVWLMGYFSPLCFFYQG